MSEVTSFAIDLTEELSDLSLELISAGGAKNKKQSPQRTTVVVGSQVGSKPTGPPVGMSRSSMMSSSRPPMMSGAGMRGPLPQAPAVRGTGGCANCG